MTLTNRPKWIDEGVEEYLASSKKRCIDPYHVVTWALDKWLSWVQRCRIKGFRGLRYKIKRHYDAILATLECGVSSAKVEALNNKIKLLSR